MSEFRKLSESFWASPQISEQDVAEAGTQGFAMVINNRPDGEDAGQPEGDVIAAAARAQGMDYRAIPVDHTGFGDAQIAAMAAALAAAGKDGKVLAYCRSGTRSTFLWALAQATAGNDPDEIAAAAMAAGYDLTPIRQALDMLAARADD
ncbi:TIGR01244 family sulfur transferase [Aurantiacibacter marinus]|uniref:Beta-lactamase hydrolase-like protein phosphatase-like domain-containing protein n=1 Tax=Aurantiacibacter marinus TaxID=874156 RepID=A0A0H0XQJ4_9SPHN|nr:TIGR01244 family sulfur transferase [Aurantiacibacter marinus]KLI64843.1 hypothetical protein AAV99_04875 [Aurantiacibacter marinus]